MASPRLSALWACDTRWDATPLAKRAIASISPRSVATLPPIMGTKVLNGPLPGISSKRQRSDVRGRDWATACCPHTEWHAAIGCSLPRDDPGTGVCHAVERHLAKHLSRDRRVGQRGGARRAGSAVPMIQGNHAEIVFAVSNCRFRSCRVDDCRVKVDRRHAGGSARRPTASCRPPCERCVALCTCSLGTVAVTGQRLRRPAMKVRFRPA